MANSFRHKQYIWQREEWPAFRWDADALTIPLNRLSNKHGILCGRMSILGFKERTNAGIKAMTDDLVNSSEIEGVMLNPSSVRSSIARRFGIENDGLLVEDHYVEGLVDVMIDAIHHSKEPLTAERMFGWHAALFPTGRSGMNRITVGDWRQGEEPMQVVSGAMGKEKIYYEAPSSIDVPMEMTRLIDWCNVDESLHFIKAAIAHLWFVNIHPFDDGNGRIGRTLADMMLSRADDGNPRYYSMSAEINRNKKSYYEVLERTQKGDCNITNWLLWFCDCLEKAIDRGNESIELTLHKAAYWDKFRDVAVNERQRKIINRLWDDFEGKLTTSKWAKICHCSQDTALRDIHDLISKNMLMDSGEGGRSTNYILPEA